MLFARVKDCFGFYDEVRGAGGDEEDMTVWEAGRSVTRTQCK